MHAQWTGEVERAYRAHHLRLRVALSRGRLREAERELRALQQFLGKREDPYTLWLRDLRAKLERGG